MPDLIYSYVAAIRAIGADLPAGWQDDPAPMQIAKLDDAWRKAAKA
ncbi:hypothetical protein PXK01_19615 [Phaeobacter sp. PT47_59]|nr:hypothetical protein [Phaeobacter sp. PT47_59]MDE4176370.1 hypothetical protein [Phaeobacter sp. PT47_59]